MVDEVYQLNFNDIKTLCHIHFPVAKCRQQKATKEDLGGHHFYEQFWTRVDIGGHRTQALSMIFYQEPMLLF